jgi:myo-inositol-1(or 4)-monophosphatase
VSELAQLRDLAVRAATEAGALLLDRFGGPASGLSAKSSRTDLVSDADRDAEKRIVDLLRRERPGDGLVAEEGSAAEDATGIRWLVDPLDGTINYLWGVPHWAVSICAEDGDGPLVGVVHDPCRTETFAATRGGGAWLGTRRLRLEPGADLGVALIATGFSYRPQARAWQAAVVTNLIGRVRDIRRFGSAALDLAWVAAGRFDGYYETGLSAWDLAAGTALVREAGGTAGPVTMPGSDEPIHVAARPGLHDPLCAAIADAVVAC